MVTKWSSINSNGDVGNNVSSPVKVQSKDLNADDFLCVAAQKLHLMVTYLVIFM